MPGKCKCVPCDTPPTKDSLYCEVCVKQECEPKMEKPRAPIGDGLADQFVSLMDVTKQAATMSERLRIVKLVEVELEYWKRKTDQQEVWEVLTNLIYKLTKAE